jgi:hypothetical protein
MKSQRKVPTGGVTPSESLVRYRKILARLLHDNCQTYSWYPSLSGLVRSQDWKRVYVWAEAAKTEVYGSAAEHFAANQLVALISKYPMPDGLWGLDDPETTAKVKYAAAEKQCALTNKRFRTLKRRYSKYTEYLQYMRRWILSVIGETPNMQEVYRECDFSSGASMGVHGNATNLYRKLFASGWTVGPCAIDISLAALCSNEQILLSFMDEVNGFICFDIEAARSRMRAKCNVVSCNKVSFVPKTAKTHRAIAIEPLLNSYVQKGVDCVLRKKLRDVGYDLGDQSRNSYLAMIGSRDGVLSTVDLASASDTVSIEVIRYLLPLDWFVLLNRLRSSSYELDGNVHLYEKFTSMGNGFCFPLETLVFAAAVRASIYFSNSDVKMHGVYGDDLIVPKTAFRALRSILGYCGFKVNSEKTFYEGPFRESCGADWYLGQDVRPVYMDYCLSDDIRLMIFHNATLRGPRQELFFASVREMIREWVPFNRRFCRPLYAQPKASREDEFTTKIAHNGAFSVEDPDFMSSRFSKWDRKEWRWRWREVLAKPVPDKVDNTDPQVSRAKYLAFLKGSPSGKLYLRRKVKLSVINK